MDMEQPPTLVFSFFFAFSTGPAFPFVPVWLFCFTLDLAIEVDERCVLGSQDCGRNGELSVKGLSIEPVMDVATAKVDMNARVIQKLIKFPT